MRRAPKHSIQQSPPAHPLVIAGGTAVAAFAAGILAVLWKAVL